ncbi:odorant receptor 13a-like [Cochliomyia hominivorax]
MTLFYRPKTKYGEFIKLPQVFDKVLKYNGCWLTKRDDDDIWFDMKDRLYLIYGWIVYFNMAFIIFCELAYFVANMMDVVKAVESFCTAMIGFFIVIRTFHYRLNIKELKELFELFGEKIWIDGKRYPLIVQRCNRVLRPVFVYFILMINVLALYSAIPIYVFFTTNQTMESKDKGMPYSMIFPYDAQTGWKYFVTYVAAIFAGYVVISHFYALDAVLIMFVSYLCGQFQILHGDIVRLIPECHAEWLKCYGVTTGVSIGGNDVFNVGYATQPDAKSIKLLQDMYTKRLQELSARHNELISVQLNDLVSFPLLVNVVNSTFLICFCGFQFLLVMVLQLYMICSCGSLLIKNSTDTAFYLYLSGKDFRNKLRFMIMRSYRPVNLNAMKFTILSLESFSKILSSSMSYFALLKTFLDKQKN